ncbi:hypothetical protein Bbelb_050960 [Branchiostoma belcheri]|nr:hypothetical protein Bbelb_050960 [Branchiostoma belcheri]
MTKNASVSEEASSRGRTEGKQDSVHRKRRRVQQSTQRKVQRHPGTQAECPVFEHDICHQKTALCHMHTVTRRREGLPAGHGSHPNCTQTFDRTVKMGSSERNTESEVMLLSGLIPDTSCTNNDGSIVQGIGLPKACRLWRSRTVFRTTQEIIEIACTAWPLKCLRAETTPNKQRRKPTASKALHTARLHHPDSDTDYFHEVDRLRQSIANCVSGEHSKCSFELGCPEYPSNPDNRGPAPEIPGGGNLAPSRADRDALQAMVESRLSPERVIRQRKLMTTNKSEGFDIRVLKAVPKAMNFKRNYSSQDHAAALTDSVRSGTANDLLGALHPVTRCQAQLRLLS